MDPRTAAYVLGQIAAHLELRGESTFKSRAYEQAATALLGVDTDDLAPLYRSGELARTRGLGPATLSVVRDLIETGESSYLEQLRTTTPSGLIDLMRVPGLGTAKIHKLHEALGIDSIESLEEAARDGRVAKLPRYGPKTAEKILRGIERLRAAGSQRLYPRGAEEGARVLAMVRAHPDVLAAEVAGSIRRRRETVGDVDVVAACGTAPKRVATSFANAPGVRSAKAKSSGSVAITYVDGTCIDLHCVAREDFAIALWRATGSADHLDAVAARLAERGFTLDGDRLLDERHGVVPIADEETLYAHAGLAFVPPELREGRGEIEAAAAGPLPALIELADIRGVLHCHSTWSDGKATILEMATAARELGYEYVAICDHTPNVRVVPGLDADDLRRQGEEIAAVNEELAPFRVLRGTEVDIRADGMLDLPDDVLAELDWVQLSLHAGQRQGRAELTRKVTEAMRHPAVRALSHPKGRIINHRPPNELDLERTFEVALETGVALETNGLPDRLDLSGPEIKQAIEAGVPIVVSTDAHSVRGLENMRLAVHTARRGWATAADVVNTRPLSEVLRRR